MRIENGVVLEYDLGVSHNVQDAIANGTAAATITSQEILIAGKKFTAITSVNLTREATVCTRRVEDLTEIADHVNESPMVFDFELELLNGESEYTFLDNLCTSKEPFTLTTHRGVYSNMILSKLSDKKTAAQSNTTSAMVTIKQILIGKTSTIASTTISESLNSVATTDESAYLGSATLKSPYISKVPDTTVSARTEGTSIVQHCDGLTAKIDALKSMNKGLPTV